MTGIIDYDAGNISSVSRALDALRVDYIVSKNPAEFERVDRLIIPGVGEAAFAMKQLKKTGFDSYIIDSANSGIPVLGICLGSQIVLEYSEEGNVNCLGLIQGKVRKFPLEILKKECKIPHMGWNNVSYMKKDLLFSQIPENTDFYFVHSYYLDPTEKSDISGISQYGIEFACTLSRKNVFAVQFHPEKSGSQGLKILQNFSGLSKETFVC